MTEDSYIELMEFFAEKHPAIQDKVSPRFRRFSQAGETIFTETVRGSESLDINNFCLIISPELFTTTTANVGEQYNDYLTTNFEVARSVVGADDVVGIKQAQKEAKVIAESIWRELLFYQRHTISPFTNARVNIESVQKHRTSGGENNLCGYRYEITFKTPINGLTSLFTPFSHADI